MWKEEMEMVDKHNKEAEVIVMIIIVVFNVWILETFDGHVMDVTYTI